jgi:all-trans-retinol 13,14-reductase
LGVIWHTCISEKNNEGDGMFSLVVGFLPWIILAVLGERWLIVALVLALVAAGGTSFYQLLHRELKILDSVTFAFFVCMVVAIVVFHWMTLAIYMSVLVNVTLTAIAWGSLVAGVPFTVQYAREKVAPELWRSPIFIRINQYITAVWGLNFFLATCVSIYRLQLGNSDPYSRYAWVAFALGAAIFTVYFPEWYKCRGLHAMPPSSQGDAS